MFCYDIAKHVTNKNKKNLQKDLIFKKKKTFWHTRGQYVDAWYEAFCAQ